MTSPRYRIVLRRRACLLAFAVLLAVATVLDASHLHSTSFHSDCSVCQINGDSKAGALSAAFAPQFTFGPEASPGPLLRGVSRRPAPYQTRGPPLLFS